MSNVKISGVSQTKFFNMTKEALSLSLGSNITRTEVVDKFLMNLFRLKNKHSLCTLFDKQKDILNEEKSELKDKSPFSTKQKEAIFEYQLDGSIKLVKVYVKYEVVGYKWDNNISISQALIDQDSGYISDVFPSFTDYNTLRDRQAETNNQKAATNLHLANNHAFELATWINTVKCSLEPNDLKSDNWDVQIFGCGLSCNDDPRDAIDGLKYRAKPENDIERPDIESILLTLAGVNTDKGYFQDDVIYAIEKMRPLFGHKFDCLLVNN